MKQNILLLITATLLATFTYFYQEVGDKEKKHVKEIEGRVLDPEALGELIGFSLAHVDVAKQGGQYLVTNSGQFADERKIETFMQLLSGIKIKRKLKESEVLKLDKKEIFPSKEEVMTFIFSKAKVIFRLGKKLSFDRTFYMEVENGQKRDIVIAFDSSSLDGVYQKNEAHRAEHHYKRFRSLFYLNSNYFLDYRIFKSWMQSKWSLKTIELNNSRNKVFKVDLTAAQTSPPVPKRLKVNRSKMKELERQLASLEGKSFGPNISEEYSESAVATLKVESSKGIALLSLRQLKKDTSQHYIHSSLDNFFYKIDDKQRDLFLGHVQLFWKLNYLQENPEFLSLKFDTERRRVSISNEGGLFVAKSTTEGEVAKHLNIKKLIDLLRRPARYWVTGQEVESNYIKQFELDWGQGAFYLMIRRGELLVYDKVRHEGLVYTFNGSAPVGLVLGDYFL